MCRDSYILKQRGNPGTASSFCRVSYIANRAASLPSRQSPSAPRRFRRVNRSVNDSNSGEVLA